MPAPSHPPESSPSLTTFLEAVAIGVDAGIVVCQIYKVTLVIKGYGQSQHRCQRRRGVKDS